MAILFVYLLVRGPQPVTGSVAAVKSTADSLGPATG